MSIISVKVFVCSVCWLLRFKIKFCKCLLLFSLHTIHPLSTFSDTNDRDVQYNNGRAQTILTILEVDHETNRQGATLNI